MKKFIPFLVLFIFIFTAACGGNPAGEEPASGEPDAPAATAAQSPDSQLEPGSYAFVNANDVRDVIVHDGVIYAATLGGMVVWNLDTGLPVTYSPQQGMTHVSAYSITYCEIPEPRILVGTLEGISIFDPVTGLWEQRALTPADSRVDLSKIERLYCDQANNRLLIGYYGLGVLDLGSGAFQRYTEDEGLLWDSIADIAVNGSDIWIATGYKGIARISDGVITNYSAANGMPDEYAYALAFAPNGTLWVGADTGMLSFANGQWALFGSDSPAGLNDVYEIEIAPDGSIWAATLPLGTGRLCQFNPAGGNCVVDVPEIDDQGITALALTAEGKAVYGTDQGVYIYQDGPFLTLLTSDRLPSNYVDSFASAPDGSLWVGTDNGIVNLDPTDTGGSWKVYQPNAFPQMGGSWAADLAIAPDGTLWAAIINGSASRYQDNTWTAYEDIYSYNTVTVDNENRAWFGDDSNGIIVLNADGTPAFTLTEAEGLLDDSVYALLADDNGRVWIGTGSGVAKFENNALETVFGPDDERLPSAYIRALALDRDGALLIGSSIGIVRYDGTGAQTLVSFYEAGFSDARLVTLAAGSDGRIWAGTDRGVLYSDDGLVWTMLTTDDGLLTNYISALAVDEYGSTWIGGGGSNFDGGGMIQYVP